MALDPLKVIFGRRTARIASSRAPLPAERRAIVQRLQVGFFGLGAMILLIGLANIIMNSVQQSQASTVPEAAPTVMASQTPAPARDPLADAGVVPDLPAEPDLIKQPVPLIPPGISAPAGNGTPAPRN